jgi:hypothetical protein
MVLDAEAAAREDVFCLEELTILTAPKLIPPKSITPCPASATVLTIRNFLGAGVGIVLELLEYVKLDMSEIGLSDTEADSCSAVKLRDCKGFFSDIKGTDSPLESWPLLVWLLLGSKLLAPPLSFVLSLGSIQIIL